MNFRQRICLIAAAAATVMTVSTLEAAGIRYDIPPSTLVSIVSVVSPNGVWDQPGYPVDYERGAPILSFMNENKRDQLYRFEKDADGWWHIIPQTGGAVTLEGNKNGNGVRLVVWDHDREAANQKFLVQHQGNGRFKIFSSYGRVVTLANRSSANGSTVQTWDNHDGAWTEWTFVDYHTKKVYIPETADATPDAIRQKSGTLKDAISSNLIVKKYFESISAGLFEADNAGNVLQKWISGLSRNDQIQVYSDILTSAIYNKDAAASISIFKSVSEAAFRPGKGFAENLSGNMLRKQYADAAAREKNADRKKFLEAIADKIK